LLFVIAQMLLANLVLPDNNVFHMELLTNA